jgi:ferredoxin-NADP reductase/Na+-translocating ferredoxin:NAD+ oxidoreductase RnfD subunit
MYRLLVYGLSLLAGIGLFFSYLDILSISTSGLLVSFGILMTVGFLAGKLFAKLHGVTPNAESSLITTLILFCILPPATTTERALGIGVAAIIAIASKYVLAIGHKHIFNPAAIAAVIVGQLGLVHPSWWIGSSIMLPFTLLVGLLVVRKIRRFHLVFSFMAASLLVMLLIGLRHDESAATILQNAFTSWPLIFFATIMLTEPATMPPNRRLRILYGVLVGVLFASQLKVGQISSTPEVALIIGNLFSYFVSSKQRLRLKLKDKIQISPQVFDYVFTPNKKLNFIPGQYLEWTLGHKKVDARGNRRTFTIASSPTEPEIHLGVKFYEPSSSFKKALQSMRPGDTIAAGQLAGDFTLPKDPNQKLAFIAGGIGITPFRSMLAYLADTKSPRDIALFYAVTGADQVAYSDILENKAAHGAKIIYVLSTPEIPKDWKGETGFITPEMITKYVPDYKDRTFYISGPNAMVDAYKSLLSKLGIPSTQIKSDYFPGY